MNPYKRTDPVHGVCEHARSEWVGPATCIVLGLIAAAVLAPALRPVNLPNECILTDEAPLPAPVREEEESGDE